VLPDRTVNGSAVLAWSGRAYELALDISGGAATTVGYRSGASPTAHSAQCAPASAARF